MKITKNRFARYSLKSHLVFVTKKRQKVFNAEHLNFLENVLKETIEEMGGTLEEFKGGEEFVHLLISYPPKWSISDIVNNLKARSSRLMRRDMPAIEMEDKEDSSLWYQYYLALSVGEFNAETVDNFITKQFKN